jgi:hypothetical protein
MHQGKMARGTVGKLDVIHAFLSSLGGRGNCRQGISVASAEIGADPTRQLLTIEALAANALKR